jgi:hypothetical protein
LEQQRKKEFEIINKRYLNVRSELEAKFRKESLKLDRDSTVKKMQIRETAKRTLKVVF